MTRIRIGFSAFALMLLLGTFAHAANIVYNNGGPNQQNGNEMTEWIQTEDFTLGSTQTITDIHFWDIDENTYLGSISWWITGDNLGNPDFGNILASGSANAARAATGNCVAFGCEFTNDWNISPLTLAPGLYHLALHNGDVAVTDREEFYWETTNPNGTTTGLECNLQNGACYNNWFNNGQEHAFYLTGGTTTPEPGTLALLGSSVVGLAGVLRRKLGR